MAEPITDADAATYSDFDNRYLQQGRRFGVERVSLTSVPEIDLSAFVCDGSEVARAKVAAEIRDAAISTVVKEAAAPQNVPA
jgi:hypothetical protein